MLSIIDKHIGTLLEEQKTDGRIIVQEVSNPKSETKRTLYYRMLKNTLELLGIGNKGYSQVFLNQLNADMKRTDMLQTSPLTKSETLLLVCVYSQTHD